MVAAWIAYDLLGPQAERAALAAVGVLALAFVVQIAAHRRVRRTERWEGALAALASEGLLRLERDWRALDEALPARERASEGPDPDHPYARDLDVTGRASLTRLAGPVTSLRGRAILRGWLLEPAPPVVASARQGAVRELAARPNERARFTALGRLHGPETLTGLEPFFAWAEGPAWGGSRGGVAVATWLLPPLLLAGIAGSVVLALPAFWILPALGQLLLLWRIMPETRDVFGGCARGGAPLRAVVPQLALLAGLEPHDPVLESLATRLGRGDASAHRRLARLSKLLDTVESRRNMFYALVAPVLLLDLHLGAALERWRAAHGASVRDWLEAQGEWEALSALAALAHDHPAWADPTFASPGTAELTAAALGHPLLSPDSCVRNDVGVGPPGTFLFVTGSNMSGKSTLLRAIGANAVLAGAGGPVCAASLTLPSVRVCTSMRVEDSLAEGISLFMAELLRIKAIVESADRPDERPVLFLLDEILHGTNTAERQIAARGVLRHLISAGAIGAVSTHDLDLADARDLRTAAQAVHFREQVEREVEGSPRTVLTFDYLLRPGTATTRNALKLLDAVGLSGLSLDVPETGPSE